MLRFFVILDTLSRSHLVRRLFMRAGATKQHRLLILRKLVRFAARDWRGRIMLAVLLLPFLYGQIGVKFETTETSARAVNEFYADNFDKIITASEWIVGEMGADDMPVTETDTAPLAHEAD